MFEEWEIVGTNFDAAKPPAFGKDVDSDVGQFDRLVQRVDEQRDE
jgi:hypothetical protein